jgi:hypothetical protein
MIFDVPFMLPPPNVLDKEILGRMALQVMTSLDLAQPSSLLAHPGVSIAMTQKFPRFKT